MNKVKMLSTQLASDDGITVRTFMAGHEYEITDTMLRAFIDLGAVELVENKANLAAPENKAKRSRKTKP